MGKRTSVVVAPEPAWQNEVEGHRVVLFDLDATLIDSDLGRGAAWKRAVEQLGELLANLTIEQRVAACKVVYDCHHEISATKNPSGYEFGDIRQRWNTRSSYAILIAWYRSKYFPSDAFAAASPDMDTIKTTLTNHIDEILIQAEPLANGNALSDNAAIEDAIHAFWRGDWSASLYLGVKEMFSALTEHGIAYCVATEGDLATQWKKICAVQLNELNPATGKPWVALGQLLATSEAARPQEELAALSRITEWYRGRAAASREAAEVLATTGSCSDTEILGPEDDARSHLDLVAAAAEHIAQGLSFIAGLFRKLDRKRFENKSGQKMDVQPEFFSRVISAINHSTDNSRDFLGRYDLDWNSKRNLRVLMVGDNFANDVYPMVVLSKRLRDKRGKKEGKITPIWVQQGKYGLNTDPKPEKDWIEGSDWVRAASIKEAFEKYLLDVKFWRTATEAIVESPPLFSDAIAPQDIGNVHEMHHRVSIILTGVGAIRSDFAGRSENAPSQATVMRARRFVDILIANIVSDVAQSEQTELVMDRAFALCNSLSDSTIGPNYPGLPLAAIDFLLSLAQLSDDRGSGAPSKTAKGDYVTRFLKPLGEKFLTVEPQYSGWAAAIITCLVDDDHSAVATRILKQPELLNLYCTKLGEVVRATAFPLGFPIAEASELYGVLQ